MFLVLDWIFGLILKNSGPITKIRPNACRHLKNLCKLCLRPEFGKRTKSDLFYQVTNLSLLKDVEKWPTIEPWSCLQHAGSAQSAVASMHMKACCTCNPNYNISTVSSNMLMTE